MSSRIALAAALPGVDESIDEAAAAWLLRAVLAVMHGTKGIWPRWSVDLERPDRPVPVTLEAS